MQSQETYADQMARSAMLKMVVRIEQLTERAKARLNIEVGDSCIEDARMRQKLMSPLFVQTIELHGSVCRDMYDHAPGYAYFYTEGFEAIETPPYCRLSLAMSLGEQMLNARIEKLEAGEDDEYDGLFTPSSIVLKDQFGNVVQEYRSNYLGKGQYRTGWIVDLPQASEWDQLESRAKELKSEAAFESGWDNFDTGRSLSEQASSLQRRISIAKSAQRIVR